MVFKNFLSALKFRSPGRLLCQMMVSVIFLRLEEFRLTLLDRLSRNKRDRGHNKNNGITVDLSHVQH